MVLLAVVALAALAVAPGRPAVAQQTEQIERYDVEIVIEEDGSLRVTETIAYDFGDNPRHGIFRDIPTRLRYDDTYDRKYPLSEIEVDGSPGTPVDLSIESIAGGKTRLRIGDPDRTITGPHTYTVRYRVEGALNGFAEHDELYWNAIGADWDVPIGAAIVHVLAPTSITRVACFAGATGSGIPCESAVFDGNEATFEEHGGFFGLTVVVAIPTGVVPPPEPILVERWSLRRAFTVNRWTVGGAIALAFLLAAGIGRLLWVAGRDRRWAGSAVNAVFGSPTGETERVALFEGGPFPVEYTPPEGLRPGQIGTLVDEVAHPVDVTATIIDLAVRGHLRIEEVPPEGLLRWFGKIDWRLVRLESDDELRPFEWLLYDGLFEDGEDVLLSSLRSKFVERLRGVQDALYADAVERGWFLRNPATTRNLWLVGGLVVLGVGVAAEGAAIAWTKLALVPLALPLAGLVVVAAHRAMPRRTAKGTAALRRALGFRRFIETAEVERARFAERANLFYEYLPYAIVFGATERWAKAFEGLSEETGTDAGAWYVGSHQLTDSGGFADALDAFAVTSSGTIASTPGGSGSSGFGGGSVGGGGGGGGGGSW